MQTNSCINAVRTPRRNGNGGGGVLLLDGYIRGEEIPRNLWLSNIEPNGSGT
jgi:hypothetical protein